MIRFHRAAIAEGFEAEAHYAAESADVALRFREAMADGLAKIAASPFRWAQDEDGFRRYKLIGFPYLIFFEPQDDGIRVYAVAHGARKPGYWHGRAEERR